jgi:peptide/nickel transport system permease protein
MIGRRVAIAVLMASLAVAAAADFLAAEMPLVLRWRGSTYWLANLIDYPDLRELDGSTLTSRLTAHDWALWAPVRYGPEQVRSGRGLQILRPPDRQHWLGTDDRGRDVAARLVHGTRATALVALGTALVAVLVGMALALAAVRWGPVVDALVVGSCDVVAAVPALILVVAAQGLLGRMGLGVAIALLAIPRAADIARIGRASLNAALAEPFCEAAHALGASRARVVVRHAWPHVVAPVKIAAGLTAVTAILSEAALSFLGFGVPAPQASWGELLRQAHENDLRWWLAIPAGLAVTVLVAACNSVAQPAPMRLAAPQSKDRSAGWQVDAWHGSGFDTARGEAPNQITLQEIKQGHHRDRR